MAQRLLGELYRLGKDVPQDYAKAVKWYHLSARQNDAEAQTRLGFMLLKGQGTPQDFVLSHMWLNLAAAKGDKTGIKLRDILAKQMRPADISKAQQLAREWVTAFEKRTKK